MSAAPGGAEQRRLAEARDRVADWKRWGPYLAERQWGTVREDYSAEGDTWGSFPHDHARSRAYRWGEDGLLGITDRKGRLCLSLALWNERDPILKERPFGLSGPEGNHGEDVKDLFYYLDATPTHSYGRGLYKYPQCEFPYARLVAENRVRGRDQPEVDLEDLGVFDDGRYFDVVVEHAKASPEDVLVRVRVTNHGPDPAPLHVIPQAWFRNTWSWGRSGENDWPRPSLRLDSAACARTGATIVRAEHASLGTRRIAFGPGPETAPELLFTENETNRRRLWGVTNPTANVKDAFHDHVVGRVAGAVSAASEGTKVGAHHRLLLAPGASATMRLRLLPDGDDHEDPLGEGFDETFRLRMAEADEFWDAHLPPSLDGDARSVARQALSGVLWSKQFYRFVVLEWLDGDPVGPPPPEVRRRGRNSDWAHVHANDVLLVPDKWEYPWPAAWDLAFHCVAIAKIDPELAKEQLVLMLREWYMHPNGQLPAYEWSFGDVNPPVHAWAVWRVYKMSAPRGQRDRAFLARCFEKLLVNFTWWVNRKDAGGKHVFGGGFLGLDNVSVFDRSQPLPGGGQLEQADGTAWMAAYALTMLAMALELAQEDPVQEDLASKFFEHFVAIADAMNTLGGRGLWDDEDGFYYDQIAIDGDRQPLRLRSMVGIVPLFAAATLEIDDMKRLPGFGRRLRWFLDNRRDLARQISYMTAAGPEAGRRLLASPSRERLVRVLHRVLDEREFLSPHGVRSLSKAHEGQPFTFRHDGASWSVAYAPAESPTGLFGGNSNWRGPVWLPLNYMLIEALERFHHFYGDTLKVECPTGSGRWLTLREVADDIDERVSRLFLRSGPGRRPCLEGIRLYRERPECRDLVLFHEYFDGDTGRGLGASHQTGWTALAAHLLIDCAED